MNKITRNIPNAITCGNLFCGCLALVKAFEGDLVWTAYLVGIALVFDFFDGFTARLLKVTSPIGKDIDSLADMVTFGVVPGIVMYKLLKNAVRVFGEQYEFENYPEYCDLIPFVGFIIVIFSAIRLAKFNNDARQTDSFIGLPTPANAILICSFPLLLKQIISRYSTNPIERLIDVSGDPVVALSNSIPFLIGITFLFCFLLVAPIPLFSLKFKSFGWKGNEIRFLFLGLAVLLLALLQFIGIPLVIVLYILLSIVNNLVTKK